MEFQLPKLDGLISKDVKLTDEDIRKYIHVVKGHAVVTNGLLACVNLREYVKIECEITDEDELEELTEMIEWMEGKSFPLEYWKELTKKNYVKLISEKGLEIENLHSSKILIYEDSICNIASLIQQLTSNLNNEDMAVEKVAFSAEMLGRVLTAFKAETKGLSIILKTTGEDTACKFQVHKKDYIFGLIPTNYDASNDIYNFMPMKEYHTYLCQSLIE